MRFSTARLVTAVAAARRLDGAEMEDLSGEEFEVLQETVACLHRQVNVLAAVVAADASRRERETSPWGGARRRESAGAQRVAKKLGVDEAEARRLIEAGSALGGGGSNPGGDDAGDGGADKDQGDDKNRAGSARRQAPPRWAVLAAALSDGTISVAAASVVKATLEELAEDVDGDDAPALTAARLAGEAPAVEGRLVAKAARVSVKELRRACRAVLADRRREQAADREARHRARRSLTFTKDADGMTVVHGRLDAASAAPLMAWCDAQVRHAFQARRDERTGDERTAAQIRVDALVSLARHGMGCEAPGSGVSTEVVVRIDEAALRNDLSLGSVDDLTDPITMGTLRLMTVDAQIRPAVMGGASVPLDWGRARRLFTAQQRRALAERDGGCAWCLAPPSWCVTHHADEWVAHRGPTDLANGVLLCVGCHVRLHESQWRLEMRGGRPWFLPPPDAPDQRALQGGTIRLDLDQPALA
ncbi:HNH endonuclease signature motif containing protein [Demequina pelophila]|uniref:HNH endonuclease signature motif containing protein n=1 Tax=Demequina pelophila TaxID=1638984 RepID=UPI000785D869|nr:HNH endonuclease signature motif containing protein [Demequina pelophila]